MKKLNIFIFITLLLLFSSCNNWLTVEPKAQTTKDKMFSTELGYTSALMGLYLELQKQYTPSSFMMGGNLEYMANNYIMVSNSSSGDIYYYYTHHYSNGNIDGSIGTLFEEYYKIIANANELLDALKDQNVLTPDKANIIRAEALAIRAYCHFELLRLWGPAPAVADNSHRYLPYVTRLSTDPYPYTEYASYVDSLKADFSESASILQNVDPIVKYPNSQLNSSYTSISDYNDLFWYNRQKRFNYYGVKALMARLYLWTGDNNNAYQCAKEVVNATNPDGTTKFSLGTQSDITNGDYLLFNEHLIGLDITDWVDRYGSFSGRYASLVNTSSVITNRLFENQTDMRLNLFSSSYSFSFGQSVYGTIKYRNLAQTSYGYPHSIPLVRLSEMYLILMETAPINEADTYYRTFRAARAASYTPLTEANRMNVIIREYIREFFSEEQSFFAYKRLNSTSMLLSNQSVSANDYVLPLPTNEVGNYK